MVDNTYIADKIKITRESMGLTQEEFGALIGVSKQSISSWEKGRNLPDIIQINVIASLAGKSLSEFFNDGISGMFKTPMTNDFTKKEFQIINKLRAMHPEKRKAFEVILGVRGFNR